MSKTKKNNNKLIAGILVVVLIAGVCIASAYYAVNGGSFFNRVLASDDFSGTLSKWTISTGIWTIANGELSGRGNESEIANLLLNIDVGKDYEITFKSHLEFNWYIDGQNEDIVRQAVWRYTDNNNYYFGGATIGGVAYYRGEIKIHNSGISSTLSYHDYDYASGWTQIKIVVKGSVFTLYVNGVQICTATDTTYSTGKVGLSVYGSEVHFDDFKIVAI